MDDISRNIKSITDESDHILYRLSTELKNGVVNMERGRAASGSFYNTIRGSEEGNNNSRAIRKYTFG